jgi:hypothetical protein
MKCPHCGIAFHEAWSSASWAGGNVWLRDAEDSWTVERAKCPDCAKVTMRLRGTSGPSYLIRPQFATRIVPPEVADPYASDFREACSVLAVSPKASAALSRRCLQMLLRDKGGVKPTDLSKEIGEAMPTLPTHLAESIDAIRNIGNFAAHPNKSTNTAEVIDVEPGEAEWCLDVLEGLFDFYFVQPTATKRRRDALNQKLAEANKPPMK